MKTVLSALLLGAAVTCPGGSSDADDENNNDEQHSEPRIDFADPKGVGIRRYRGWWMTAGNEEQEDYFLDEYGRQHDCRKDVK